MTASDTPRTDAAYWSLHTISDFESLCRQLELELAASKAEVEHIKSLLKDIPAVHINTLRGNIATLSWDSYEHILGPHPCRERAEKAEAEVDRLKEQLTRSVLIADKALDYLIPVFRGEHEELEAELKQLKANLNPATEESSAPQL